MKKFLLLIMLFVSANCFAETYEKIDAKTLRIIDGDSVSILTRVDVLSLCEAFPMYTNNLQDRKLAKIAEFTTAKEMTSSILIKNEYDNRITEKTEYFDNLKDYEMLKEAKRQEILEKMDELGIE